MALIGSALQSGDEEFLDSRFCQAACKANGIDLQALRREHKANTSQEAHA